MNQIGLNAVSSWLSRKIYCKMFQDVIKCFKMCNPSEKNLNGCLEGRFMDTPPRQRTSQKQTAKRLKVGTGDSWLLWRQQGQLSSLAVFIHAVHPSFRKQESNALHSRRERNRATSEGQNNWFDFSPSCGVPALQLMKVML